MFARSAAALSQNEHEMISIKITGLMDMNVLKAFNDAVDARNRFWNEHSQGGYITGQQMFDGIQQLMSGVSD